MDDTPQMSRCAQSEAIPVTRPPAVRFAGEPHTLVAPETMPQTLETKMMSPVAVAEPAAGSTVMAQADGSAGASNV